MAETGLKKAHDVYAYSIEAARCRSERQKTVSFFFFFCGGAREREKVARIDPHKSNLGTLSNQFVPYSLRGFSPTIGNCA